MDSVSALPGTCLPTADEALGRRVLAKVTWRLLPLLCLLYIFNLLDRSNVGFARLTMQEYLGMSPAWFDIGYGLFYLGYILFEVPSNLLLRRFGARRWISRILISWGIISSATLAVTGPVSFALIRILLGIAEAGFFPGMVLYLTFWFPARDRARVMAYFMIGSALAGFFGNPVSGAIMENFSGVGGLADWQWLFLLEGLPSVILGVVVLFVLTDQPKDAQWLTSEERDWLVGRMEQEDNERLQRHGADKLTAMFDRRVWVLIGIYFTVAVGTNASGAYLPTLVRDHYTTLTTFQIGLLSALPHLCAMIGMTLWSVHSDRTGERSKHVAGAAFLAAGGWILTALHPTPELALLGLCIAQMGMMSMLPTFWTLPTVFLSGAAAAGGIALINSVANIGGLLGPSILGQFGLWAMVVTLAAGGALALVVQPEHSMKKAGGGSERA